MYPRLCDSHYVAYDVYDDLMKNNSKFSKFVLKVMQSDVARDKPNIPQYYEVVEKRLGEYGEFVRRMRDASAEGSKDRALLSAAREACKDRLAVFKATVRGQEDIARLAQVQKHMVDLNIYSPFRRFIHGNPLQKVSRKAVQQRMFFLFSDVLVYAKAVGAKDFKSKGVIPLGRAWLKDLPDTAKVRNGFQIVAPEKTFTVFADTPELKNEWILLLSKVIANLERANPALKDQKAEINIPKPTGIGALFTLHPKEFDPDFGRVDVHKISAMAKSPGPTSPVMSPDRGMSPNRGMSPVPDAAGGDDNGPPPPPPEAGDEAGEAAAAAAGTSSAAGPSGPKARPLRGMLAAATKKIMAVNAMSPAEKKADEDTMGALERLRMADAAASSGTGSRAVPAPAPGDAAGLEEHGPPPRNEQGELYTCAYCNQKIETGDVVVLDNGKIHLHGPHFACAHCNLPLVEAPFVTHNSKPYCSGCYGNFFAKRCCKCSQAVLGKAVNLMGSTWHPQCFSCGECGVAINPLAFKVSDKTTRPVCDGCFAKEQEARGIATCPTCGKGVFGGDTVQALGGTFHGNCFICVDCGLDITDSSFLVKGGRPAHQRCQAK